MKNKKWFIFGLLILAVICVVSLLASEVWGISQKYGEEGLGIPARMVSHRSVLGNFTILLPETFSVSDTPQGSHGDSSIILAAKNLALSIYIEVSHYATVSTMHGLTTVAINKLSSENVNYNWISMQDYSDAQNIGIAHEYTMYRGNSIIGGSEFHCLNWYTINKTGYAFSFCVNSQKWEMAKSTFFQIIDSISFQ